MTPRNESRKIALGGIFTALATILMMMGGIIPFATFAAPALAGILIVPAAIELGMKTGFLLYGAIGLLSFFVVPDKEMSLIFIFFFGFYPLVKAYIERCHNKVLQWAIKFGVFNLCIVGMYSLILFVFPIGAVVAEFQESGTALSLLLLVFGNVTFVIYDIAIAKTIGLYCAKFRTKIMGHH